jgi:hypothetical protein
MRPHLPHPTSLKSTLCDEKPTRSLAGQLTLSPHTHLILLVLPTRRAYTHLGELSDDSVCVCERESVCMCVCVRERE